MSVSKYTDKIIGFYFLMVTVLMYYFITEVFEFSVHITYRHVFALVIAFSAALAFFIKPNIARGVTSFKSACVYSVPLLVTTTVSLLIWSINLEDFDVISRGLSMAFFYMNMFSSALAAAALLYIFGEKGIWYNLIAILISNLVMIALIIVENGLGVFISELVTLVVTFAGETGDIIVKAEIHELAFCLGAYLVYMVFKPKKDIVFWILLALTAFCFIAAFKRIAIAAIAVAVVLGWILLLISKRNAKLAFRVTQVLTIGIIVILIGYVAMIKMDVFSMLQDAGVETSGRDKIYGVVDRYYEFSPTFMGNGIGFLTYQLNTGEMAGTGVGAVHNDFLQHYIDLGFWGYIIWLVSMTILRVNYFGKKGKTENAIVAFVLIVYLVIVSSTDNTMNYPLLTTVLAVIMIGHGYDDNVRSTESKMFGYISDANKEVKRRSIL